MDISQSNPVTSTPVGGARPKVRHSLENQQPHRDLGAESCGLTAAVNQSVEAVGGTQVSRRNQEQQHNYDNVVVIATNNKVSSIL